MSQIMKGYLGVFLILILMMTSIGILSAFMMVVSAQDIHSNMIDELENSACAQNVLENCFEQAQKAGYELSVNLFYEDGTNYIISSAQEIPDVLEPSSYARVELGFPLKIGFFEFEQDHVITGYAR